MVVLDGALVRCPANAALDKVVELGDAKSPPTVAIRRVKQPPLAMRADPCPRFLAVPFLTGLKHMAVLLVVLGVNVGLVPGAERLEAPRDGMFRVDRSRFELARSVPQELCTDERDLAHV